MPNQPTLLVSILSLGRPENVLRQLVDLPGWLTGLQGETGLTSRIVVRNNDPAISFAAVAQRMDDLAALYPDVICTLVTDVANNGFGGGHNSNIAIAPSDYVLILNDDIGFPHMAWLGEALRQLQDDNGLACIAAEENPCHINPLFGNGVLPGSFHLHALTYGEASILLCRRVALEEAGFFHADFAWAMCEDADLSLRLQQMGWRIGTIAMPHQHWRSTSFNSLPGAVKSSILEHNRAALFANWRESLATARTGRFEVYDIWSEGLGDVLCALPHILARLEPLTATQRAHLLINTSHPEVVGWLGLAGIRVMSEPDLAKLRNMLRDEGITTIRSTREANFSLPFNIHALLAGTMGIAPAGAAARASLAERLAQLRPAAKNLPAAGSYTVVHLEFDRDHEGRALPPAAMSEVLTLCGKMFDTVVLVGRERRLSSALCEAPSAKFIDLQGALSVSQLAGVIARAGYFVGIDSFPGHLAQAAGVPAAVFFGAVHPLTRAWQASRLWPLMADLACIGCYHTHLEPSVPFCMRRDQACTTALPAARLRAVLQSMIDGEGFDWSAAEQRLQALQARLLKLAHFHPAPPERLFRGQINANEKISNLIYRMTDQVGELLRGQYQTTAINGLLQQVHELQSEVFAGRVRLDDARNELRRALPSSEEGQQEEINPSRILQLAKVVLERVRCETTIKDQWIDVEATDDDPQLLLPPIQSSGGKIQLRLSCVAEPHEALQIYWALGDASFSTENLRTVPSDATVVTANIVFDVGEGETLRIRIDPTTGAGLSRLHGSLGGAFVFLAPATDQRDRTNPATGAAASPPPRARQSERPASAKPASRTTRRHALT